MKERLPFIDWMKCLGMLIIIYGHTAGRGIVEFTPPFNPKQLGVAFFVFVMGFSLARETRPAWQIVYNRFFEMALFGWIAALLVSSFMLVSTGDLAESNYLPLLFGVNVFFDFFPANPTTWYIGTYLHLLLLWAFLGRRWIIPTWVLPAIFAFEIVTRALLIEQVGNYVAYMFLTNWIGVLIFGMWAGQRPFVAVPPNRNVIAAWAALATAAVAWPLLTAAWPMEDTFPFRLLGGSLLLTSVAVSALYTGYTWAVFQVTRRFPDLAIVRLIARNTVVVFIAHMPLVYLLTPLYYPWVPAGWPRVTVNLLIFFLCLSLLADLLRKIIRPAQLRDAVWVRLARFVPLAGAIPSAAEKARQ
jgi:hypothetical protein